MRPLLKGRLWGVNMKKRKKTKMNKKQVLLTSVTTLLIVAVVGTIIFFGVRTVKINEYKENRARLPQRFTITAHTGCMGTEDNSIEAMRAGVANGADIIEFDVHFTEDGVPVLAHDEPKGDELGLEVAFEFLAKNKSIRANVDMKSTANMAEVQKLADKYGVFNQIFFTGINIEDVEAVKKGCPRIPYYLNVDVDKSKNTDSEYIKSLVNTVKEAGAVGINFNYKGLSSDLVSHFRASNLLVSIWTVDSEYDMHKVLTVSVDNITTRNPDKLTEIIG